MLLYFRYLDVGAFDPVIAAGFSVERQRRYDELDPRSHRYRSCFGGIWTVENQLWSRFVFERMCFAMVAENFEILIVAKYFGWHIGVILSGS